MCNYCKNGEFILKEKIIEISIINNELLIDLDNSKFDEGYYIGIHYCPICGRKLV